MKLLIILLLTSLIIQSCINDRKSSNLRIDKNFDTVTVGQIFTAKLYINNYNYSKLPTFNIYHNGDTARIPFEENNKCGIINIVGRKIGINIYKGFVEYYDINGELRKEEYSIEFFVK